MIHCMNAGNGIIGNNLFYVFSQFDCNITMFYQNRNMRRAICMTVEFVRRILNIPDGVMKVSYMNVDEVQDIIEYVTVN